MSSETFDRVAAISLNHETATLRDALQAIERGSIGMALLCDGETRQFRSLVTDGDLRRALIAGAGLTTPISIIAPKQSSVGRVGQTSAELAALFSEPIRVVPILDDENRVVDIAFLDRRVRLPVMEPTLGELELQNVTECVLTGWISSTGKFVAEFEKDFANFVGAEHAVSTSNGTTALHLAVMGLGIGPGDEVIVPTLSFIATANAVAYTGATPVFVDSEASTWNMDPSLIAAAVTPRTKAIMPVHLYGHPANMGPIMQVASDLGLHVLEDAAEAHGAEYDGRRVGTLGAAAIFSFYGNKIITTGEGGMITTNDPDLAARMRVLRDHGMEPTRRYWHPVLGYNYRLTNLQAAIGVAQLKKVETILADKQRVARLYERELRGVAGLTLPPAQPWAKNVNWLYSVLIDDRLFGISRDNLIEELRSEGIETRPLFIPMHKQPVYDRGQRFPVAERLADCGLSLPSAVGLHETDIVRVANTIREVSARARASASVVGIN